MAVTRGDDGSPSPGQQGTGQQGTLFDDSEVPGLPGDSATQGIQDPAEPGTLRDEMMADEIGYRGPTACAAAGITYRQLDYWALSLIHI